MQHKKPNQTEPIQTRSNHFPLNAKSSLISYPIFIKFGMVICITLGFNNMQSFSWSVHACIHGMQKCAYNLTKYVCSTLIQWRRGLINNLCKQKLFSYVCWECWCYLNHQICSHLVTTCSFRHNLTCAFNQKNSFTKTVKLGLLRKEMLSTPLKMHSFGHKMFISSQPNMCL